jgi:hypothetical protein
VPELLEMGDKKPKLARVKILDLYRSTRILESGVRKE